MQQKLWKQATARFARIGQDPTYSSELRLQKRILTAIALLVAPVAVVWGTIYWSFGERLSALIPLAYICHWLVAQPLHFLTQSPPSLISVRPTCIGSGASVPPDDLAGRLYQLERSHTLVVACASLFDLQSCTW